MKDVCIDVRMAFNSGIGTYIRNIIPHLKNAFKLKLIAHEEQVKKWPALSSFDLIMTSAPLYSIQEQIKLPLLVPSCDLFWTPHFNVPLASLRSKKRIATIHDVYHLAFGNTLSWPKRLYARVVIDRALKASDHILTVSQFSKDEIIKYTGCPPNKISVIHLGVDQEHYASNFSPSIREKYHLPQNYFLFVSTLAPHKNVDRLLKAWNILGQEFPDWKLILVGKKVKVNTWQTILEQNPSLQNKVMVLGQVDHEDLPLLYQLAYATVHPSLYEGFGLTPLEAMSSGCPAVVSKVASLPEICGENVVYVDPYDVEDIAAGMRKLILDPHLHAHLKEKGLERSRTFTWNKTIEKHVEILDGL